MTRIYNLFDVHVAVGLNARTYIRIARMHVGGKAARCCARLETFPRNPISGDMGIGSRVPPYDPSFDLLTLSSVIRFY